MLIMCIPNPNLQIQPIVSAWEQISILNSPFAVAPSHPPRDAHNHLISYISYDYYII